MKRELILWAGGGAALFSTVLLVILLTNGFQSGSDFAKQVEALKSMHSDPPPTFSIRWETRSRMGAERVNPQRSDESVLELAERTIAEVQEIQRLLPVPEDR